MFNHSTNTASFFSVLVTGLIFSLSAAGGAWAAQAPGNTKLGKDALKNNTTGSFNTAIGVNALFSNTEGTENTAIGVSALEDNIRGFRNTASGANALSNNTEGI